MTPSVENPLYLAYVITADRKYNVTNAIVSLDSSEQEKQIAACMTISLVDADVDGKRLSDIIKPRHRVIVEAYDGKKKDEVFRGYVWDISTKESLTAADFSLKCYDNLIYWQESEDSDFFAGGKSTEDIIKSIAAKWGIRLTYEYESITHEKLVLRGAIADFITADILDTVQKRTGQKYILRSEKDTVIIKTVGTNETVYNIVRAYNATELRRYISLNGVTTQVVILGTASDDAKTPVEATIRGETEEYGTLQKIVSKSEDTTLEDAKEEADTIIKEDGKPKWEYDVTATDIPWIRKGDKVKVVTETLNGKFIVKSISRDISNRGKTMSLTVVDE